MKYQKYVTGGIPPDPDHVKLFQCCYKYPASGRCDVTQEQEPLIVAAADGKMCTFCNFHYNKLVKIAQE